MPGPPAQRVGCGLLSDEVRDRPFQWGGLKLVAAAQWDLKDWEGTRASWEAIREIHPNDIDANLALANVYERLYKGERRPELIEASDQAIQQGARQRQGEPLTASRGPGLSGAQPEDTMEAPV
ncbi:MAG: hypothetical protein MZV70_34885 [Desulfobacterales bacterium]|nr:hypothetical protein [Desulfobacterales bacterium]